MRTALITVATLVFCLTGGAVRAWEVTYDASAGVPPSAASPAWTATGSDAQVNVDGGALHILDGSPTGYALFGREFYTIDAGVPATVEARMRVASSLDPLGRAWTTIMSIQTKGAYVFLTIYPDHLRAYDALLGEQTYVADFSRYRTIRLAYDGARTAYVGIDGLPAFSWALLDTGGQGGISFGAGSPEGTSDSYWQYVSYSKAFLPVPEPSSLLALALPLAGAAIRAMWGRAKP